MDYCIIKKITSLNLEEKCYEWDNLLQSDDHEDQVDYFKAILEDRGLEIFEVRGHQFMTDDGVYTIASDEEILYGDE